MRDGLAGATVMLAMRNTAASTGDRSRQNKGTEATHVPTYTCTSNVAQWHVARSVSVAGAQAASKRTTPITGNHSRQYGCADPAIYA